MEHGAWSIEHRVKRQRSEVRGRKSEGRGQKEIRSQRSEVGDQKTEGRKLEVGGKGKIIANCELRIWKQGDRRSS